MFLLHKTMLTDQHLEYVRFDDGEIKHFIMNRVNGKMVYENEEWDWVYNLGDILPQISVGMDDDTEIIIVPAKEVEGVPPMFKNGYFYY